MKKITLHLNLKPETRRMLLVCGAVFFLIYAAAVLAYGFAGRFWEYHLGLMVSEGLAKGLRTGFGITCLGVLVMESVQEK